jgi:hypothetical protein
LAEEVRGQVRCLHPDAGARQEREVVEFSSVRGQGALVVGAAV